MVREENCFQVSVLKLSKDLFFVCVCPKTVLFCVVASSSS